jgi:hypothetical protein
MRVRVWSGLLAFLPRDENPSAHSLHNLTRIRDRRIRTQNLKPRRNLVCAVMSSSDCDRMPERAIDHDDSRIHPSTPQKRRNRSDSNPTGHDRDDRIVPG